jgi:hypothetical protein
MVKKMEGRHRGGSLFFISIFKVEASTLGGITCVFLDVGYFEVLLIPP